MAVPNPIIPPGTTPPPAPHPSVSNPTGWNNYISENGKKKDRKDFFAEIGINTPAKKRIAFIGIAAIIGYIIFF